MRKVDRVRVHRRDQVQAPQDQFHFPRVANPTGPHLIGAGLPLWSSRVRYLLLVIQYLLC